MSENDTSEKIYKKASFTLALDKFIQKMGLKVKMNCLFIVGHLFFNHYSSCNDKSDD
ncbi:hypothetical protein [Vibrio aestuarianus]|uniref:hypothetical protein n=1 Tax=Vibrio aestuarianus TaxID=28171 RepID=UPI0021C2F579|nr:hypothetical protein [Vibrio aestuarianus]MDE1253628.1 hypothetical protein [Vibrio aestuarianus]MDE1263811.1 hypothetical protein [Vibrio aestuarianus]MDE1295739.1 hypothetical protein [Vibrio aestuarianus]CAH8240911.1 hypothetical protein VAEKB19_5550025 [Vibrio aestuarianus]